MATFDNDTFHFDDFQFQTVGFSLLQLELQRVQIDPMAIVGRIPLEIESTIKIPLWLMNGRNSISFVYIYIICVLVKKTVSIDFKGTFCQNVTAIGDLENMLISPYFL